MSLLDFFIKDVETRDHHPKKEFRTHYYKAEYPHVKEKILAYLKRQNVKVQNIDDNFGEILASGSSYDLIISVKKVTVIEHAVDFKLNMKGLIGAKRPFKIISEFYNY